MRRVKINSGTGTQVTINAPGQPGTVTVNRPSVVEITDHLYGADAAITQCSDTLDSSVHASELYGFKYNIQLTAFINGYNAVVAGLSDYENTGKIKMACYIPTDRWKNPTTSVIGLIPDYEATTWTSAGATAFGVTAGQPKAARFPNHGQEMFDLTSGAIGWDYVNGIAGANNGNELFGMMDTVQAYFVTQIGKKVASGAYRNGRAEGSLMFMRKLLGGRNSELNFVDLTGDAYSNYGVSKATSALLGLPQTGNTRQLRISTPCSTRLYDQSLVGNPLYTGPTAGNLAFLNAEIVKTIANGGYILDFIHWQNLTNALFLGNVLLEMNTAIGSNFVHRGSYNEIIEYLFLRDMASVTENEVGSTIVVDVVLTDPYDSTFAGIDTSILLDLITVPISVRINLANTVLAGLEIASSNGTIRKVATDIFILNIPFEGAEGTISTTISATGSPSYLNFDLPEITSSSNNGTTLQVNTDINTKAVLFKVATGSDEKLSTVQARSNVFGTTHNFDVTGLAGQDFRVGVISETNQTILSGIIT